MSESDSDEFVRQTDPFRRELLVHCYRMLGSVHDAEDLVQETYLRAWRSFHTFEGRSSLRIWLYRIATMACLTALEHRSHRVLPSGLGAPDSDPARTSLESASGIEWIQPLPDALGRTESTDPAAIVAARDSIRLAFIAALQHLPAKQRAVLILRDVLAWRASEAAELLGTTTVAVNSALQRARIQLERAAPAEDELVEPTEPRHRALLDQYMSAFENADIATLLKLLREDVELEMPPLPGWLAGRENVGRFFAERVFAHVPGFRMVLTTANGQPAVAAYVLGPDGAYHAHSVVVITTTATGISHIYSFSDRQLFDVFGLPAVVDSTRAPMDA